MNHSTNKVVSALLAVVVSCQSISCGTILYPERRNQKTAGNRLDVGVMLLDAVGLVFFIVPGLVAFGVDFATGAIYLPPDGNCKTVSLKNQVRVVRFDPKKYTPVMLEELIGKETGREFHFSDNRLKSVKVESRREMMAYLKQFENTTARNLASLK
jgi:hypothetical protein